MILKVTEPDSRCRRSVCRYKQLQTLRLVTGTAEPFNSGKVYRQFIGTHKCIDIVPGKSLNMYKALKSSLKYIINIIFCDSFRATNIIT